VESEAQKQTRAITLKVVGIPKPQGRPRARAFGGHARVYSPSTEWATLCRHEAALLAGKGTAAMTGPCQCTMRFYLPRPKSLPKKNHWPTSRRGELDNLIKATLDALVPALLADDSLVVMLHCTKQFALGDNLPGCEITLEEVGE